MKHLLRFGISAAILGLLSARTDWSHIADTFRGLRWADWWLAVGVFLATQVVSALRWRLLAKPLGFAQSAAAFIGYYYVGMFFNLLLPTSIGGDAVRAVYVNAGGRRRSLAFLSVLLDRLSGLTVLVALACVAAIVCPVPLPDWVKLAVAGAAIGMLTGIAILAIGTGWLGRFEKLRNVAAAIRSAPVFFRGHTATIVESTVLSLVIQLAGVVQVALLGRALGLAVPLAVYGVAVPMVALLTLLPISLNGMGVREAGMLVFLGAAGVPAGPAVAVAFLWFCVQTVGSLAGAGLYLFGRFPRPEVRHDGAVGDRPGEGREGQHCPAA